jgi:hypothetical protein
MKRYKPFKFDEEVIETDSGLFRGEYKGRKQYFQTKDDAEQYEKQGNAVDKDIEKQDKEEASKKDREEKEKNAKLGVPFESDNGDYIGVIYEIEKGKEGKKDKKKSAYFYIDDYQSKNSAIKAALAKVKNNKPSLFKDLFGI